MTYPKTMVTFTLVRVRVHAWMETGRARQKEEVPRPSAAQPCPRHAPPRAAQAKRKTVRASSNTPLHSPSLSDSLLFHPLRVSRPTGLGPGPGPARAADKETWGLGERDNGKSKNSVPAKPLNHTR